MKNLTVDSQLVYSASALRYFGYILLFVTMDGFDISPSMRVIMRSFNITASSLHVAGVHFQVCVADGLWRFLEHTCRDSRTTIYGFPHLLVFPVSLALSGTGPLNILVYLLIKLRDDISSCYGILSVFFPSTRIEPSAVKLVPA